MSAQTLRRHGGLVTCVLLGLAMHVFLLVHQISSESGEEAVSKILNAEY